MPARGASSGVTIVELMFAIAILASSSSFAVPSYRDAATWNEQAQHRQQPACRRALARSEAIKANAPTTLCTSEMTRKPATLRRLGQGWVVLVRERCRDQVAGRGANGLQGFRVL